MFERKFDVCKIQNLSGSQKTLWDKLQDLVKEGKVFPAVRKDELHFYYKGGVFFKFSGNSFKRDRAYLKYGDKNAQFSNIKNGYISELSFQINSLTNDNFADSIEQFFTENEKRFTDKKDDSTKPMERQILDELYKHTFSEKKSDVIVLDIEVCISDGSADSRKKCDMVLLHKREKKIMFVEGKIADDRRMATKDLINDPPEVIKQVNGYTQLIANNGDSIIAAYENHISIINELFKTNFPETIQSIISGAKLLVYGEANTANCIKSKELILKELGSKNVLWYPGSSKDLSLNDIWDKLSP